MSRGQITIIILVAVVIGLIFLVAISINQNRIGDSLATQSDIRPMIRSLTESCLEQTLSDGVIILAAQGGYVYPEAFPGYQPIAGWNVGLDYYYGYDFVPTISDMEKFQLGRYVAEYLPKCVKSYSDFNSPERKLEIGNATVNVMIGDNQISVVLHQPITVLYPTGQFTVENFAAQVPAHIPAMRESVEYLIRLSQKDPAYTSLSALRDTPFAPDVMPLWKDVTLTTLVDDTVRFRGKPLIFMYASLFGANLPPKLLLPGRIELSPGEKYKLRAEDPENGSLRFRTNSTTVSVTSDGYLTSTPGRHVATIFLFDPAGFSDVQSVEVIA